jgi:hypothetical protein
MRGSGTEYTRIPADAADFTPEWMCMRVLHEWMYGNDGIFSEQFAYRVTNPQRQCIGAAVSQSSEPPQETNPAAVSLC